MAVPWDQTARKGKSQTNTAQQAYNFLPLSAKIQVLCSPGRHNQSYEPPKSDFEDKPTPHFKPTLKRPLLKIHAKRPVSGRFSERTGPRSIFCLLNLSTGQKLATGRCGTSEANEPIMGPLTT